MVPDLVTIVDHDDNVVGADEKIRAHREGTLHRAFSVFVFDDDRRLLGGPLVEYVLRPSPAW